MVSRWEEYHARTAGREPRPLLLRACELVQASFAEAVLPEAHLVHAGYSLPFCAPAVFPGVWAAVRDALVPGGPKRWHAFGILARQPR